MLRLVAAAPQLRQGDVARVWPCVVTGVPYCQFELRPVPGVSCASPPMRPTPSISLRGASALNCLACSEYAALRRDQLFSLGVHDRDAHIGRARRGSHAANGIDVGHLPVGRCRARRARRAGRMPCRLETAIPLALFWQRPSPSAADANTWRTRLSRRLSLSTRPWTLHRRNSCYR